MINTSFSPEQNANTTTDEENNKSDEIFHKEQDQNGDDPMSWLRANFFLADKRVLFGTWNGVFTSIILNIFGVLIYLRAGWMVANAGILQSLIIVFLAFLISFITISSAIVLCEKCKLNHEANIRGGIFYLLSDVIGIKVAVCIGLFYCFGQAVNLSLTMTAFGDSICFLLKLTDENNLILKNFFSRFVAVTTLLFILSINIAGIKWILRLQIILLFILLISFGDTILGSFLNLDPENGIVGYSTDNFLSNFDSNYSSGDNIFTVYGVFFPATTGIFTGLNMAYELKNPGLNIPVGSYGGIFSCLLIYTVYFLIYGCVVLRSFLYTDFFIGEKISYTGYLFLVGFYVCSISSSVGSFYAPSRLIQSMAKQELFPKFFSFLKNENGKNKLPIPAMIVVSTVTFAFTVIGQINILAPIVSMPYMLTYAAINYAFFALKTCQDSGKMTSNKQSDVQLNDYELVDDDESVYGEQTTQKKKSKKARKKSSEKDNLLPDLVLSSEGKNYGAVKSVDIKVDEPQNVNASENLGIDEVKIDFRDLSQVDDSYKFSRFSNKWVSLLGAFGSILSMILVNYIYAIMSFIICYLIFLQLRFYKPGLPKGSSHLNLDKRIADYFSKLMNSNSQCECINKFKSLFRKKKKNPNEFMVVIKPVTDGLKLEVTKSQISLENVDYSGRKPYHHYNNYGSDSKPITTDQDSSSFGTNPF